MSGRFSFGPAPGRGLRGAMLALWLACAPLRPLPALLAPILLAPSLLAPSLIAPAVLVPVLLAPAPATAASGATTPPAPVDLLRLFAICAGRFSALAEHEALFDGAASDRAADQRDVFLDLLGALHPDLPAISGQAMMAWRVSAKQAQAMVLLQARFHADPARAARATRAAGYFLAECRALLPGG